MEYKQMLTEYNDILLPEDVQNIVGRPCRYRYNTEDLCKGKRQRIKREISEVMKNIITLKDYSDQ